MAKPRLAIRQQIDHNVAVHNRIAEVYDQRHGEIFNQIEQDRLGKDLRRALAEVATGVDVVRALDVGCGSGNLTSQMLRIGCKVTAADVSQSFLNLVSERFRGSEVSTLLLNGSDLSNIDSDSFDFVATYSVLHHIPDYLAAVADMARICKPGGVVFLDHEPPEHHWTRDALYAEYKAAAETVDWSKFLKPANYYGKLRRLFFDPKYAPEGDIHVWPDDHIDWAKIEALLVDSGFQVVIGEDYLLYRSGYRLPAYEQYKNRCTDMRVMAFRNAR